MASEESSAVERHEGLVGAGLAVVILIHTYIDPQLNVLP